MVLYHILAFEKTTDAMAAESWCREQGLPGRLIPLPKEISAGCGLCYRVKKEDFADCEASFRALPVKVQTEADLYFRF